MTNSSRHPTCPIAARALTPSRKESLEFLIAFARDDTGGARRVRDFLLSWWDTQYCGGWNPVEMWYLDRDVLVHVINVVHLIAASNAYPDTLGYQRQFASLVREWRPRPVDVAAHGSY